ncbi:MAG: MptD family putative ECF transporter S component [Bacteroidales bacterium]|nr:MptD family putative ECF transporter S component [Bacteroidales bacterium]
MEKILLKWYSAVGMGLLYMATVFAACFFGFIGPACWAFFPVVAALLGSGAFFWLSARWQKFGVGTFAALLVCLFCLATGEAAGFLSKAIIVAGGIIADVVRLLVGNDSKKGLYAAYPFLAIGNIGWIVNLWTRPQWYLDGAVEEMGRAYADGMIKLQNPATLCLCIILTAAVAVLGIWLCGKVDKKSAKLLK